MTSLASTAMTSERDTLETTFFLDAFQSAWKLVIKDYDKRLINGEHTMQASLYRHLLDLLPNIGFRLFTEAKVTVGDKHKVIDLLIVHGEVMRSTVIAAIELKFTPRGVPAVTDVRKDLNSLSLVANRKDQALKPTLKMVRFLAKNESTEEFKILPQKKLIFAVFCNGQSRGTNARMATAKDFWKAYKDRDGRWAADKFESCLPSHFGIAIARTTDHGKTEPVFLAPIFERMMENHMSRG
jgi:hypothetical protein